MVEPKKKQRKKKQIPQKGAIFQKWRDLYMQCKIKTTTKRQTIKTHIKKIFAKQKIILNKFWTFMLRVFAARKILFVGIFSFLFLYYGLGCLISENIDTVSEYRLNPQNKQQSQTVEAMHYLILREVDDKLWTPNLPAVFPAAILDNMPNFQKGTVAAIKNITNALRKDESLSAEQQSDLHKAYKLLNYAPNVWLLSANNSHKIAPSTNKQYRKAAKFLHKFNEHGAPIAHTQTLNTLLEAISSGLTKISQKSESHQQEHSNDYFDFKADDIFYYNLGYAFALLQISKAMGEDFKYVILENNAYVELTYLLSSLQKVTQYRPLIIRNAEPQSFWAPNHLVVQNYYISRAISWTEKMRNKLFEGKE